MAKMNDSGSNQQVTLDTQHDDEKFVEIPKETLAKLVGLAEDKVNHTPTIIHVPVKENDDETPLVNCLRPEKVIVKYIDRPYLEVHDKTHVFYGGKAENATDTFPCPVDRNGKLLNVLTKEEKKYLEHIMGVEPGYLSVYNTTNNFWRNLAIPLRGRTNMELDLSNPNDYIIYKTLLATKLSICPDTDTLKNKPKATYRYVLVRSDDEVSSENMRMTTVMKASILLGSFKDNYKKLKYIVTTLNGRAVSEGTKLEFLQNKAFEFLSENPGLFVRIADDPYIDTKITIFDCVDKGIIRNSDGNFYYEGKPLSNGNVDPSLDVAAQFINLPSNQDIKFSLQAKLDALKEQK